MKLAKFNELFKCVLIVAIAGIAPLRAAASNEVSLWPFYTKDRNVFGEERVRALGPFFQRLEATNGASMLGAHPFYSRVLLPEDHDKRERHVLWPVWFGKGTGHQYKWQALTFLFWHDYDVTLPHSKHHLWLLPIYFQGRNADGAPYVALFPVGGKIRDFLGSDEMEFVLFPLYGHSRIKEQETTTWLWPVYSRTDGQENQRLRVFPFYGRARCRNYYDKIFFFWPLWSRAAYNYRATSGYSYFFFPLWGHLNVTDQEAWWIAPPFIRFSTRGTNRLYYLPWPFLQIGKGEVDKFYLWPVFGHKRAYGYPYMFALWPIIRYWEEEEGGLHGDQLMIMPVWYSHTTIAPADGKGSAAEVTERSAKFWPFFTYQRKGGNSRLGAPSLCPFRNFEGIERNYAPLWTIYSRQRCNDVVEDDLLWGLFRHRRGPNERFIELFPLFKRDRNEHNKTRSWSFLQGLASRKEHDGEVEFRLLYFFTLRLKAGVDFKDLSDVP